MSNGQHKMHSDIRIEGTGINTMEICLSHLMLNYTGMPRYPKLL